LSDEFRRHRRRRRSTRPSGAYDLADGCRETGLGQQLRRSTYQLVRDIALNGQGQLRIVGRVAARVSRATTGPARYTSAKITTRGKMAASPPVASRRASSWPRGRDSGPPSGCWAATSATVRVSTERRVRHPCENQRQRLAALPAPRCTGPGTPDNTPFVHVMQIRCVTADMCATPLPSEFHTVRLERDSLHISILRGRQASTTWCRAATCSSTATGVLRSAVVRDLESGDRRHIPTAILNPDAIFPATMLVDYVRVYRREN